jgi:hypothetical protein
MFGQLGTFLVTPPSRHLLLAVLVPGALGAALLHGSGNPRRVLLLLAGVALVALLGGSLAYDLGAHFLYLDNSSALPTLPGLWPAWLLSTAIGLAATGVVLAFLAGLLGIGLAARVGHWRWVAALTLALVVGWVLGSVPFTGLRALLDQVNPRLAFSVYFNPYTPATIAVSRNFYFWLTLLSCVTPLASFLYSLPARHWAAPSPALAGRLGPVAARLGRVAALVRQRATMPK